MAPKVSELLTPEQVRELRGKSDLVGALLVLHAWALIVASMALFVWWPNPLTFLLAVMVIGARQLGLAILMHDAAHGLLFANRRLNEWVGAWLCASPVFTSLALYRPYHLTHHRHTQQAEDPDLGLSAPFPISRAQPVAQDRAATSPAAPPTSAGSSSSAAAWPRSGEAFVANLVLLGGLAAIGYWWLYPVMWLLPLATWYQLVSRIRNIAEHAVVPDNDDPLRNTRTTLRQLPSSGCWWRPTG